MNSSAAIILGVVIAVVIVIFAPLVLGTTPRRLLEDFLRRVPRRERVLQHPLDLEILGDGAGTALNLPRMPPPAYIARSYDTLPVYTTHSAAASSSLIASMDTPPPRPPRAHAP
ncbi:hypothetical protein EXIGLDRAFT_847965 [Exidia glandulosa HHB12029]|uniref:Uncharacterized protein n=1 Tax=Exidia glandulosa HHB12029 TaxID=1314781 RepID=A0A166MA29_EXIGL|nr:hypothetical protein EXIGLDRAFT_847965 [Exidia glandulosa HHB12029]